MNNAPENVAALELAELDRIVEAARAQVKRAQAIHAKGGEASAALELANRELTANPSEHALAAFVEAHARSQSMHAAVAALESTDALNPKVVINAALGTERGFALLGSAWGKRLTALEGLRRIAITKLADGRRAVSVSSGQPNPWAIEYTPTVTHLRNAVATLDRLSDEARFGISYCETQGAGREEQDLTEMLELLRRPLPTE